MTRKKTKTAPAKKTGRKVSETSKRSKAKPVAGSAVLPPGTTGTNRGKNKGQDKPSVEKAKPQGKIAEASIKTNDRIKIVEIMGLPAVGKSTVLQKAHELAEQRWILQSQVTVMAKEKINNRDIRPLLDGPALSTFISKCIGYINDSPMSTSQKLGAIRLLDTTARQHCMINLLDHEGVYVCDELFAHRSFSTLAHTTRLTESARWYFDNCPVPDVVIIFSDAHEKIFERLKERKQRLNTLYGLSEIEIQKLFKKTDALYKVAAEKLRKRGAVVHELQIAEDVSETAGRFLALVSG